MNRYGVGAVLLAAVAVTAAMPMTAEASNNYEMRKKVIGLSGIVTNLTGEEFVTRAEFAQMLLNASPYKSLAVQTSSTAVFSDVPASSQYASAVRIASENGWMTGYLGGLFKPDQQITLQEAVRGVLALLGYTNDDFPGDQINGRWAKYIYLEMGENIGKQPLEVLTRQDCVNLFYNLLCTENKAGKAYCTVLGYELSSDGEVNALTIADNELKGPKVVKKSYSLDDYIPFDVTEATYYLNGEISSLERVKQEKANGFVVIYYNTNTRTVWAYTTEEIGQANGKTTCAIKGTVTGIYYSSSSVMTPSSVVLDDETSSEFRLNDSDVQFAFSIYGDIQVGDEVILICEVSSSMDGDESYTVIDYIEY